VSSSKTYYVTIPELRAMGGEANTKRVRVGGDVQADSIVRGAGVVSFNLVQAEQGKQPLTLHVVYEGRDPLPDTFKDGAQALVEGKILPDNHFEAEQVQAKCASKYEAAPVGTTPAAPQPGQTSTAAAARPSGN